MAEQYTIQEFGKLIKKKYPEYNKFSDEEIAQQVLKKYPQYSLQIRNAEGVETKQNQEKKGFLERFSNRLDERAEKSTESLTKSLTGQQSPASGGLQIAGQAAGAFGDLIGEGLVSAGRGLSKITPDFIEEPVKDTTKGILSGVVNSKPAQGLFKSYQKFKQNNPTTASNIEAVGNIASVFPITKGSQLGVRAGAKVAGSTATKLEASAAKSFLDDAIEVVAPKLTIKDKKTALRAGQGERSLFGKVSILPSSEDVKVAQSVAGVVSKNANPVDNIRKVLDEIGSVARNVENGLKNNNAIYSNKQLKSVLSQTKEESTVVFGTNKTLERNYDAVIDEFMKIKSNKPNTLSGLLEARKEFDRVIESKFPGLFDKIAGDNVRRNAVLDIRRAANQFIADKLPEGNPFKADLMRQSNMYKAVKNISDNAATLVDKNILDKALSAVQKHPLASLLSGGVAVAGISSGLLASIISAPVVLGSIALGASYRIGKTIVTSTTLKKALAAFLKRTEKVLSASEKEAIQDIIKSLQSK